MPSMDATSTAAISATGVNMSDVWGVLQYGFSVIISVGLWFVKASIPFLVTLAVITAVLGIIYGAFRLFHR